MVLVIIIFNMAHGRSEFPRDYYRKSKGIVTWKQKINPWWWTLNDDDPIYPIPADGSSIKNDRHWPKKSQWHREVLWWIRNPMCNFRRYIVGFWDKRDWWTRERRDNRGWTEEDWNGKDTMWPLGGETICMCAPWISIDIPIFGMWFRFNTGWKPNGEWTPGAFRRRK